MIIGAVVHIDPEHGVPVFRGRRARRALVALYGLPNAAASRDELAAQPALAAFTTDRSLFVDDGQDGKPMALWIWS